MIHVTVCACVCRPVPAYMFRKQENSFLRWVHFVKLSAVGQYSPPPPLFYSPTTQHNPTNCVCPHSEAVRMEIRLRTRILGSEMLRIRYCLESRLTIAVRLSALCAGCRFTSLLPFFPSFLLLSVRGWMNPSAQCPLHSALFCTASVIVLARVVRVKRLRKRRNSLTRMPTH
jgi:hypothetical protein